MKINGLSMLKGSLKGLRIPSRANAANTGRDNRLILGEEGTDMSLVVVTPVSPPEGSVPSIGLSAKFIETLTGVEDYAHSIDGTPYFDTPGNVTIETTNVPEGSPKVLRFNSTTSMYFPLANSSLAGKKFYIKTRCFVPSNSTVFMVYFCQQSGNYTDRLLIGSGGLPDQNLNLWNNQQNPRVWYGTDIAGAWREIIFHYDGVGTFKAFLDGTMIYAENYTIQPYTLRHPSVRLMAASGVLLEHYEIQIEGVNWQNPQLPSQTP